VVFQMIRWYKRMMQTRPLLTQMVSSGMISAAGDAIAQFAIEKRSVREYDLMRTARFFVLTGGIIAPALSRWFIVLEKINKGPAKLLPLKRLAVDQAVFAPTFNAFILVMLRVLEGYTPSESVAACKRDWWGIWTTSLKVWPLVNLFNFYLVPLPMRVIFVQFVALFWNSYLSFVTQPKLHPRPHEADY
ncbi:hypothetical protein PFISCL1PPCAC_22647, partial [Pristionchus fissidentatus]